MAARKRELEASKPTVASYADGELTTDEAKSPRELRGKVLGSSFEDAAVEVAELRFALLRMSALSAKILVFLKGATWAVNCDLLNRKTSRQVGGFTHP